MSTSASTPLRRLVRRASVGVALAAISGSLVVGWAGSTSVDAAAGAGTPATGAQPLPAFATAALPVRPGTPLTEAARPVRIQIPALRINAALDPLRLNTDHVLVPPAYGRAGWYAAGPEPGEPGRAVIAGHVDSMTGPDVFSALGRAHRGDRILIRLADGTTLVFVVDSTGVFPRDSFPSAQVYGGRERRAEVRLITCGGPYDKARGGYQDNVIVFGHLVRHRR